jgi:hypothetical protein
MTERSRGRALLAVRQRLRNASEKRILRALMDVGTFDVRMRSDILQRCPFESPIAFPGSRNE